MTYTQRKRNDYAALIIMARCWRISYRQARDLGANRAMACRMANAAVSIG